MHLIPTNDEVVDLLRRTGGLRDGHFEYADGLHGGDYLQVAARLAGSIAALMGGTGLWTDEGEPVDARLEIGSLSASPCCACAHDRAGNAARHDALHAFDRSNSAAEW